jgi:hypothetical protein
MGRSGERGGGLLSIRKVELRLTGMHGNNSVDLYGSIFYWINEQMVGGISVIGDESSDQITNRRGIHNCVTAYPRRESTLVLIAL